MLIIKGILLMAVKFIPAIISILIFFPSNVKANGNFASIKLEGTVNPIIAEHIVKSIEKANKENAAFIVIKLDTPGGLMTSMRDIIKSIMSSKIPVIVYTYPKGAQAASAGGCIMISAHIAAMAPGTEIGAMHPVSPFLNFGQKDEKGKSADGIMEKKVLNDTLAYGRSIAQKKKRNVRWVENAIKDAISSTYIEAKKLGVIDIIAEDMNDLLLKIDGISVQMDDNKVKISTANIKEISYEMDIKTEFLNFFADPQIIFVLFIIAVIGIWTEVKNPGMIFPGVLGALSFFLFLLTIRAIPINIAGIVLIILAIVLFILELKFVSYGLLTIGGIISFVAGAMILFDSPLPGFQIPIMTISSVVIFVLFFIFIVVRSIVSAHKAKVTTGIAGLIGEKGTAFSDFNETGKVIVHGELWTASSSDTIKKNDMIEVVEVEGMNLHIKKIDI
jgi:membrane-bound serine protease (ClpP class)